MDIEELAARLGTLEQARNDDLQKAAQQAFMSKYGSRISNNDGLGLVILNELNRRGVDTSAADEAVQEILDQLRMECTMLLDTIKDDMQQAADLADKVDAMQGAVEAAGEATGADLSETSDTQEMPEGIPPMEEAPWDMSGASAEQPPMEQPPMEQPPMEQPPMEQGTPSDARIKRIKAMMANRHVVSDKSQKNIKGTVLNSNIIAACKKGGN